MKRLSLYLLQIVAIGLLLFVAISCSPKVQYIPVETVKTDSSYNHRIRVDSLIRIDSIYIHEHSKGDTIYRDKLVYRYRDRIKEVHDTTYINKTDSVNVPYPVVQPPTRLQQLRINIADITILVALLFGVIVLLKRFLK